MNHAAQLAIIKQLNRQESDGSAGNCQADEQAETTQLRWQLSSSLPDRITQLSSPWSWDSAGTVHVADLTLIKLLIMN